MSGWKALTIDAVSEDLLSAVMDRCMGQECPLCRVTCGWSGGGSSKELTMVCGCCGYSVTVSHVLPEGRRRNE